MTAEEVVITRDTFAPALGLTDVVDRLRNRDEVNHLFQLILEFLSNEGAITELDQPVRLGDAELPLLLGRTFHVRLGAPLKEELHAIANAAALAMGAVSFATDDWRGVTLAAIVALSQRVHLLKQEYGERCLVESLTEVDRPTAEAGCANLFSKRCRRPNAGCRFHVVAEDSCGLDLESFRSTVDDLEQRNILRRRNAVDPYEYSVSV